MNKKTTKIITWIMLIGALSSIIFTIIAPIISN